MHKTIMITGATDGLGLATAARLAGLGHRLVLHGRNPDKLDLARAAVEQERPGSVVAALVADLSSISAADELGAAVARLDDRIDVLVNNAGVYRTDRPRTDEGLDARFAVNAIAPYALTRKLLPALAPQGRVVNVSSAAQAPVDLEALAGRRTVDDMAAYAQSKLALTMWSRHLAEELGADGADGPAIIAVNPGSLLATKMVKEGFGVAGSDPTIGVDVLTAAAVGEDFASASGAYFDNDARRFADPHPDALDASKAGAVVRAIEQVLAGLRH